MHIYIEYTVAYFIFYAPCHDARTLRAHRRRIRAGSGGVDRRQVRRVRRAAAVGGELISPGMKLARHCRFNPIGFDGGVDLCYIELVCAGDCPAENTKRNLKKQGSPISTP